MHTKRSRWRPETFKMVFVVVLVFAVPLFIRTGGFSKVEGLILATISALVFFILGRISVPVGGEPSNFSGDYDV